MVLLQSISLVIKHRLNIDLTKSVANLFAHSNNITLTISPREIKKDFQWNPILILVRINAK